MKETEYIDIISIEERDIIKLFVKQTGTKIQYLVNKDGRVSFLFVRPDNSSTQLYKDIRIDLLSSLQQIKELYFKYCNIEDISPLSNLKTIEKINLWGAKVRDISPLSNLINLTELDISANRIADISPLQNLENLIKLNISSNNISDISALVRLKKMTDINIFWNHISDISVLANMKKLKKVDISSNNIKDISALKDVIINNELSLKINNNPIQIPAPAITNSGYSAIKDFFTQIQKYGQDILYEGKILIVGEAGAGKTTLLRKLEKPEIEELPDTNSTLGIEVKEGLVFQHPQEQDRHLLANVWDFGGQEVQYYLHQYFITPDALYILVSDNRRQNTQWDYWFHIINLLAEKGSVLVTLNNIETISSNKSDFEISKYRKRFKNLIITEQDVDLSKNDIRWNELQQKIKNLLSELPLVNKTVPRTWIDLRKSLLRERATKNYISLSEFYHLDPIELDEKDRNLALDYFNKIGIALNFPNDINLKDIIFLNPNWITKGLYAAISSTNKDLVNGTFTKEWIFEFWSACGYNEIEQTYLLRLMLKDNFDICYKLSNDKGGRYIIPFLLTEKQPYFIWNDKKNLGYRYEYPFMPMGILNRLIVQFQDNIDEKLVWRDGVILKRDENRAKIVFEYNPSNGLKYYDIKVRGGSSSSQKDFLRSIRDKINEIHESSFTNIFVKELVICNCRACTTLTPHYFQMYGNKGIEGYLRKGKKQIECPNLADRIDIDKLIGPVYTKEEIEKMKEIGNKREGNNITNFYGDIIDSQVQVNSNDSEQSMSSSFDIEKIKEIIRLIKENAVAMNISNDNDNGLKVAVDNMENEINQKQPQSNIIKESFKTIRNVLEGITGNIIASGILYKINQLY